MIKDKFLILILLITVVIFGGIIVLSKNKQAKDNQVSLTQITSDKLDLLKIADDEHIKGNKQSSVTLIEYLDFECDACKAYDPLIKQLSEEFKNDARFAIRYFPLPGHKNGMNAALAVEAANKQGKYWEMHNILFDNQLTWGEKQISDPSIFEDYAKQLGLNMEQFKKDVTSKEVKDRVERDLLSGQKLGNTGTPSFYLNDEKLQNPRSIEDFRTLIKAAILKAPKAGEPTLGEKVHEHADFKVYINNKQYDFTAAKYQDTKESSKDPYAHLHDGNGDVTHKHKQGVTLGYFFKSIGMTFDNNCFITDNGTKYCNDEKNSLKLLVNGKPNTLYGTYEFTDLDRILISYGPKDQDVTTQVSSVTDNACMYSGKCPERGTPPTENCAVGLGGDC